MQFAIHLGNIDLQALRSSHIPLVLDADYSNYDEIHLDLKVLSKHLDR
jgi:hypothetical protein